MRNYRRILFGAITMLLVLLVMPYCTRKPGDAAMEELENALEHRGVYEQRKQDALQQLRNRLTASGTDEARFQAMNDLFDEYRSYNTDSALVYCERREALARRMARPDLVANAQLNRINTLAQTGMYAEAIEVLSQLERNDVPDYLTQYYYYVVNNLYDNMSYYAVSDRDRERYRRISDRYKDSIVDVSEPGTLQHVANLADRCNSMRQYDKSIAIVGNFLDTGTYTTHDRAKFRYEMAEAYRAKGDRDKYRENLILSAIADQQAAVREYVSLRELAMVLYEEGDIHRAHNYLSIAMEDARNANARLREMELNKIFPAVNDAYFDKIKRQQRSLVAMTCVIALVTLLLMVAVYFVYRQMRKASEARRSAEEANSRLRDMNEELRGYNRKLSDANREIAENSKIKEEYIAQFMDQCSLSIEKLEAYRKSLDKLMRANKVEELKARLRSSDEHDEELKAFYRSFDATFLKLFPTFVEDFNELLMPEERIELKREGQLTTELRIFALIRLGITDSVKIAQFLRYSVTTIYNYRTKTRNKARGDRNRLEEEVRRIGLAPVE